MNPMESLDGLGSAFPRCPVVENSIVLLWWAFSDMFNMFSQEFFCWCPFSMKRLNLYFKHLPVICVSLCLRLLSPVQPYRNCFLQRLLVLDVSFIELPSIDGAWQALAEVPRLRRLVAEGCSISSFEDWNDMPSLKTLEAGPGKCHSWMFPQN